MAHPNEELLRKAYDAFNKGDLDFLRNEAFTDDIVAHIPGQSPVSGEFRGVDEVFRVFGQLAELSEGTFRLEVHDVLANDEHGAVLSLSSAQRGGKRLDQQKTAELYHFRNGKISEIWPWSESERENDEFWS